MSQIKDTNQTHNVALLQKKAFDVTFELEGSPYRYIQKIGTGAYGVVCCAEHKITKNRFAIKRIQSVFHHSVTIKRTLREIRLLRSFQHPNIISIRDLFLVSTDGGYVQSDGSDNDSLINKNCDAYVVFDLMQSDLHKIIESKQQFTDDHIRYFMYQILCGLHYIHATGVIHRDLKPANILVNANCQLKIGDFGMSRSISSTIAGGSQGNTPRYNLTQYVMTRWYRAPELLMGQVTYSCGVDMWSTGCILAELYLGKALFRGQNDIHQVQVIVEQLGTPPQSFMTKVLPIVRSIIMQAGLQNAKPLTNLLPNAPRKAIDLLSRLLLFEPEQRWSASQCLKHLFLNKYRQPTVETVCQTRLDFAYEDESDSIEKQKLALSREILNFHPPGTEAECAANKVNSVTDESLFSNPTVSESEMVALTTESVLRPGSESNDTHMRSADVSKNRESSLTGGQPLVENGIVAHSDVHISDQTTSSKGNCPVTKDKIPLVTDQKVKKAPRKKKIRGPNCSDFTKEKLLSALTRSKENTDKRKVVTAVQRQKEREEKKKAKMEDREKKKKQQKGVSSGNTLSPDDHKLLERWKKLHESPPQTNFHPDDSNLPHDSRYPLCDVQPSIHVIPTDDPPEIDKYDSYTDQGENQQGFLAQLNVDHSLDNDVDKQMSALSAEFSKANLSGLVEDASFQDIEELITDGWNTWLFGGPAGDIECVDLGRPESNIYFDQTMKSATSQPAQENAPNSAEAMKDWLSVLQDANAISVDLDDANEEFPKSLDEILWSTIGFDAGIDSSTHSNFPLNSQSDSSQPANLPTDTTSESQLS